MKHQCPVCEKKCSGLVMHFMLSIKNQKDHDNPHLQFMDEFYSIVDARLEQEYVFETVQFIEQNHPKFLFLTTRSIISNRRKQLGICGRKVVGKKREGKGNPAKDLNVRSRISQTVKNLWDSGSYDERINGMMGRTGSKAPNWKKENHTPTILAEKEYADFLSNFQDVNTCSRCGKTDVPINVHHIDESHENFLPSNLEPLCVPCHMAFHYTLQKRSFISIVKIFSFAGAHHLPDHPAACKYLHGHEWKMEVGIKKRIDPKTGMVMDFSNLKKIVKKEVIDILDHQYLNEELQNPTAENLTVWIWERLMFDGLLKGIDYIRLYETETSYSTLSKEGMLSRFISNVESYLLDDEGEPA